MISNYLLPTFAGLALLLLAFWILRRRSKARNP
ncbi:MAG: LPXTG cell wall anchor domain-containing protein [Mameliella sp.]|nr:LPXTG cell wall anchor domain-containing protein [Phaeodactylibacter sp.]